MFSILIMKHCHIFIPCKDNPSTAWLTSSSVAILTSLKRSKGIKSYSDYDNMFEKYANKIEYNGVEQNKKRTEFAEKPQFARNRRILQETEHDLPGAPQFPLHIPSSFALTPQRSTSCKLST